MQKLLPVLQCSIPLNEAHHQKPKSRKQEQAQSKACNGTKDVDPDDQVLHDIGNVAARQSEQVKVLPPRAARPKQPMREGHD